MYIEYLNKLGLKNIKFIETIAEDFQEFDYQGVHFIPASGAIFIEAMLTAAESFLKDDIDEATNNDVEMVSDSLNDET